MIGLRISVRINHYTVLLGFLLAQEPNHLQKIEGRKNGKGNRKRESGETAGLAYLEGRVRQPENQKPEEEERKGKEEVGTGRES